MLFEESAISPEIAEERGYYTARQRSEVPEAFKDYQRRPGLIIPVLTPSGERRVRLRPGRPRKGKDGRVRKYEQAGGVGCVLDVHPRNLGRLRDPAVPLWVVEGEKKGDALTSQGECAIALPGVWNWQRSGEMLPDWDHVELAGRLVYVCFDSDAWSNGNVQMALERLVAALEARGAEVMAVHLEDKPDGSKVGADDYLVAGGTVAELKLRARKFAPEDVERIRLSKDEKLRAAVEDLERRFWAEEWKGMGGHSDRDIALKLIEATRRHGKVVEGGIRVVKSWGALELETKVSRRTLGKALDRLEERGFACRDNEGRKADKSGAFVLRAGVNQVGTTTGAGGNATPELQTCDPGGLHLRAPRLRWSSPKYTPKRGTVEETRKVRQGPPPEPRPAIKRLGKVRGAILDALDAAGGTLIVQEIAETLHRKRPRDIRRRNLPMLEEAGIVAIDGDVVTLADNWLERLDEARQVGGEIDTISIDGRIVEGAETIARHRLDIKRKAYHGRHKVLESSPSAAGLEAVRRSRDLRSAYLASITPDTSATAAEVSPGSLAAAARDYLERRPKDARQPAGWIGVVLWSEDLYPGKPTPAEMKAAIEELGGAAYLDGLLKRAKGAAA